MQFSIGDKIQLVDSNLKGVIKELTSFKALIEDEDGFEEWVSLTNLTFLPERENYNLNNDNVLIAKEQKENQEPKKQSIAHKKREVLEVDLHIHKLTQSTKYMTNWDMVQLQLEKVENCLHKIDKTKYYKVVFIHGKGTGKLKTEVEHLLHKKNIRFQVASFQRYGIGALEVLL